MIKKHKSTILSCSWSPDSKFLVTAACDFKCRIVSATIDADDFGDVRSFVPPFFRFLSLSCSAEKSMSKSLSRTCN